MHGPIDDPRDDSIGDLFGQLIDDGRAYARAQVNLYKAVARRRAAKARNGAIALVAAAVFLHMAFLAAVIGCIHGLATLIGPLGAGLVVAAVLAMIGVVAALYGIPRLKALGGDEEEREALGTEEEAR